MLDVAGLSLFPSECATPPQATQISNARLIGCSDHSACGVAADCTEVAVSNLTINTLLCSCTGLNTPQQSVRPQSVSVETALRVAPYIGGSEGGCTSTPRHATEVYVVGETVQTVVIALHKGESYEILPTENITLACHRNCW